MGTLAVAAFIYLTYNKVDYFAFFGFEGTFSVLQSQIVGQRSIIVSIGRIQVGNKAYGFFEVVKNLLISCRNFFPGWNSESCHNCICFGDKELILSTSQRWQM